MRNLINLLTKETPMYAATFSSYLQQSNDLEQVVDRFFEWSESHVDLLMSVFILVVAVDILLILAAFLKRKWILEQVKNHDRIEQLFIISFFATVIGIISFSVMGLAFTGLNYVGVFPFTYYIPVAVLFLPFLLALLALAATFLVLVMRLFILMEPAQPAIHEDVNWGGTPVLVVALAFFAVSFLFAFFSESAGLIAGSVVLIALPVFLVLNPYARTLHTMGFRKPLGKMLLYLLPLLGVLFVGNEVVYQITERIIGEFPLDELTGEAILHNPILMGITVGILGPIGEEVFFRGFAHTALRRKYGFKKGILLSSLFFGMYHMIPWQIPYAVAAGLILAYVYEKTQSIYPPILFHIINNSIAVIQVLVWS
jgi:membrane protease YdiL (CAAX protease family)